MAAWDEAQAWFRKAQGVRTETHMVIAIDTYDDLAFPSYTDDPATTVASLRAGDNHVMEVCDLRKPLDEQTKVATAFGQRAWEVP